MGEDGCNIYFKAMLTPPPNVNWKKNYKKFMKNVVVEWPKSGNPQGYLTLPYQAVCIQFMGIFTFLFIKIMREEEKKRRRGRMREGKITLKQNKVKIF